MIEPVSFSRPRGSKPRLSAPYVPGRRHERYWTVAEDAILRERYPDGGINAVMPHLPGRKLGAIYGRANALGLKRIGQTPRTRGEKPSDDLIRKEWAKLKGKGAVADLADRLNVKRPWLTDRAVRLGLTMPHKKEPRWTPAEDALMAKAPLHDPDRAAAFFREHGFNRSPSAIMVHAKRIGLSLRDSRKTLSGRRAALILGVDDKWITERIIAGELPAVKRNDKRLPQQGGSSWDIEPTDLRRYIFQNPERIDLRKVDRILFLALLGGEEFALRPARSA